MRLEAVPAVVKEGPGLRADEDKAEGLEREE